MASIAAFTQIFFRLRGGALSNALHSRGAGCRGALTIDHFVLEFDKTFDEVFYNCRAEFVEGMLKGDF